MPEEQNDLTLTKVVYLVLLRCCVNLQLVLNPLVVVLLVSDGVSSAGDLNPAVLEAAGVTPVSIIIRITLVYTDNTAADPSQRLSLVFEVVVEPGDWNEMPCSYLEEDCVVFQLSLIHI